VSKKPRPGENARRGAFTAGEIEARVRKYHKIGEGLREQSTDARANRSEPNHTGVLASGKLWEGGRDLNSETFR